MKSQRRHRYSKESVQHALAHHESTGAVTNVEPPEGDRKTWRVVVPKFGALDPFELTNDGAFGLCIGLAAGEDHAKVEHDKFVDDLRAYGDKLEPACIEDAVHAGALVQVPDERCAQLVAELLEHTVTLNSAAHVTPKVVTP